MKENFQIEKMIEHELENKSFKFFSKNYKNMKNYYQFMDYKFPHYEFEDLKKKNLKKLRPVDSFLK